MNDNQIQKPASYGKRQEYIMIAELLRHQNYDFDVYIPLVDDRQIDCILRRGCDHYLDLQIKARSQNGQFAAIKMTFPRKSYFFIFYVESIKTRWIFPSLELRCKARLQRTGRYDITLTTLSGEIVPREEFDEYIDFSESRGIDREFNACAGPRE